MKTKNKPISAKKIPYYIALFLLTTGASLILGFLSFGGMYALIPALPLAFAAFALSVSYEGEIYLQNIKGALNKLFKNDYLKNRLAKEYLLDHFPEHTETADCPQFFKDYKAQLELLSVFDHKELNKESKTRKKQINKTLKDMEQWFAQHLFPAKKNAGTEQTPYALQLEQWLKLHQQQEWQEQLERRRFKFNLVKAFSGLAALFMGLGSTYLIVEAFTAIPFFAVIPFALWPVIIVPMALVAGIAYGMLTYNAITDLINNNTIVKWYKKIRDDLSQGLTIRNVFMATTAVFLVALAVALTICTAGTWWTVASNARPLFEWMKKMPNFIMGLINPVITGASAIFFNIQNTAESLEMVDEATRSNKNIFQRMYQSIADGWKHVRDNENWLQMLNPFRIILKLTVTPLRILLFFGHLISIALTADRMPGVPQILAALVAMISEGFEDAHYFVGHSHDEHDHAHKEHDHHSEHHKHEHNEEHQHQHQDIKGLLKERLESGAGHNHSLDIPSWLLKMAATPLYALAALWDGAASKLNKTSHHHEHEAEQHHVHHHKPVLSFSEAWDKQIGNAKEEEVNPCSAAACPSYAWQQEHTLSLIDHKATQLAEATFGKPLATDKIRGLRALQSKVRATSSGHDLGEVLNEAAKNTDYNKHRMFALAGEKTSTQEFIEELPERVSFTR